MPRAGPAVLHVTTPIEHDPTAEHGRADWIFFAGALAVFLATRLYGLERFPVYFFTDEAIQALSASDFLDHGLRNALGEIVPTYFPNGPYLNLSASVYVQVLPVALFGLSEYATRATSVVIALSGTAAVGLTLRDAFRSRFWWIGTLLLTTTPAWFLHSRTAFETVLATSFYAWFLYFYLRVERHGWRNLVPALIFAALAFYSYAATQIVVVATLALLAVSDIGLIRRKPLLLVGGLGVLALLFVPYARFYVAHGEEISRHLHTLGSYWTADLSLGEKIRHFAHEYTNGLSPAYWYGSESTRDLERHRMQGWGHILAPTLPLLAIGIVVCLRNLGSRAHRALLLSALATPLGGALVAAGITRNLVFVVPAAIISGLGASTLLAWLAARIRYAVVAAVAFALLASLGAAMLHDAVVNGPTWYRNYGLYGLQYGGRQVTSAVREHLVRAPRARITISPTWANGTDVVIRFFLSDEERVRVGSIIGHRTRRLPLDERDVFVMTPEEYEVARRDPRFTNVRVERTLPYPDGRPGFYFVRLRYSPGADAIFAAEQRERARPLHDRIVVDGTPVDVVHSLLDVGEIQSAFDGDDFTLARTFDANPAVVRLTFPAARAVRSVTLTTGHSDVSLRVAIVPAGEPAMTVVYTARQTPETGGDAPLTLAFGRTIRARTIELRVRVPAVPGEAHVHIREVRFR
jgi:4-amino-4-deoxy-L-arabinose transferase-like glycosyltransferase